MYAIAFFATVILFSAILFIYHHKYVETASNRKSSTTDADILINPSTHIGAFRKSA